MQNYLRTILRSYTPAMLAGTLLAIVSCPPAGASPVPPTDNTAPPYAAVYGWNVQAAGITHGAVTANWLYRSNLWLESFADPKDWPTLEYGGNLGAAKKWLQSNPGAKFLLTQQIIPSGTTYNLAGGATGAYNSHWTTLAQNIVNNGLANDIIVRLGHEFTGGWYNWCCINDAGALNYAAYWRQIVTTMRAVPGAANIKFDWCGTNAWTSYPIADAYPGDAYVDYVGCDLYDQCWNTNTYPYTVLTYPYDTVAPTAATRQLNAWNTNSGTQNNGLTVWKNFAIAHGKPLTIPEWGVCKRITDNNGGIDDPYFIQQMYNFIQDPANNVYYHCYFDNHAGDGDHQLTTLPSDPTIFPYSAAKYRQLFGVLPLPVNNDIGTVGLSGSSDPVSVAGAGTGFLTSGTDSFHFASRVTTGDDMFMAQITSMSASSAAQSGVMMRKSAAVGDVYAALYVQNGQLIFQSRTASGAAAVQNNVTSSVTAPVWLKLLRRGNLIMGFQSADGLNWTSAGSQTVVMSGTAYVGLAVSSGSTTALNTTGMDNVDTADIVAITPAISNKIFVDDTGPGVTMPQGTWSYGNNTLATSGTCLICWTSGVAASVKYTPTITTAGYYDVYLRWLAAYSRINNGSVKVISASGTSTSTVNEMIGDQLWVYVGTYNLAAGTSNSVELNNNSGTNAGNMVTDGAMFVPVPPPLASSLPSPKVDTDIGSPATAGSATYGSGVYTVQAAGTGFWGAGPSAIDQFNMVNQPFTGDQTIIARITGFTNTSSNASAGIMFRGTTAGGSVFAQVEVNPAGGVYYMFRLTDGATSSSAGPAATHVPTQASPIWLKLVKSGSTITGYYNSTSVTLPTTWTTQGSASLSNLPVNYIGGLAVHSHNATTLTTVTFDNVTP